MLGLTTVGFTCWKRLGDFISIVVATGLHGEIKPTTQVPFWLSECRKRTFGAAYIHDKSMANFLGRPPRLPRKYCTMQLPLDLDFHQLQLSATDLEKEIERLDSNGWNTRGDLRSTVCVRTGVICHMLNEDILELTMSSLPLDDTEKLAQ